MYSVSINEAYIREATAGDPSPDPARSMARVDFCPSCNPADHNTAGREGNGSCLPGSLPDASPENQVHCSRWMAWRESAPDGTVMLHVTAECILLAAGYRVELRRLDPDGSASTARVAAPATGSAASMAQTVLRLERIVHAPPHPTDPAVTTIDVLYRDETSTPYRTVEILPDGITVRVEDLC